jgi:hypothetical protein
VDRLLDDRGLATALGHAAHQRAFDEYLADRHLEHYAELFSGLAGL